MINIEELGSGIFETGRDLRICEKTIWNSSGISLEGITGKCSASAYDDVYKARLHKAGYDKKRQHGKSYQRAIKKVSELEELQDSLAEKWLKEKKTDGIKEIGENFGKKLQEKVMILQLEIAPGINNVEQCEA